MTLSIILPAHNEEECIEATVMDIVREMNTQAITCEIIIVDDNSTDKTGLIADNLAHSYPQIRVIHRKPPKGFGRAIREGLKYAKGDIITTVMGDASDDPKDIVKYYHKINDEGYDCAFGSRFMKGAIIKDYPAHKLFINRLANLFLSILFFTRYNDMTNAFKAYKKEVIQAISPIRAQYFNITVELPLKALIRSFSFCVVPTNWYGRKAGVSKLKIKELGKKYLFTVLSVWLEKILLRDEIEEEKILRLKDDG